MSLVDKIYSLDQKQLFRLTVVFPLILVAIYLYVFMPDRYQSSAIVLVKDSNQMIQAEAGLLATLGVSSSGASEDMKLLQAFVQSKSLALELDRELTLREHYGASWDFVFGIDEKDSNEEYFNFYEKHILVKREIETGLLEISAQAYSPEKALEIIKEILLKCEAFINHAGKVIANSEMVFARDEIDSSQKKLKEAKMALLSFQNQHSLIDPEGEGESLLSIVFELEAELAKTEAELSQAKNYLSVSAPKLKALESKVRALRGEIDHQKGRVAGGGAGAKELNALAVEYNSLLLDVELASTLYTSSLNAFELARVQAGKQLKHLVIVGSPSMSQDKILPVRARTMITSFIIFVAIYVIAWLIITAVREHSD